MRERQREREREREKEGDKGKEKYIRRERQMERKRKKEKYHLQFSTQYDRLGLRRVIFWKWFFNNIVSVHLKKDFKGYNLSKKKLDIFLNPILILLRFNMKTQIYNNKEYDSVFLI